MIDLSRFLPLAVSTLFAPLHAVAADQSAAAIELVGRGDQIYECAASAGGPAWKLKAPEAILVDAGGHTVGHHFAGPSWQAADGSKIVGAPIAASPSPDPASIPWLVLKAAAHDGEGVFANIAYVTRTRTSGGAALATGCDAAHLGAESRVSYSAIYTFFRSAAP